MESTAFCKIDTCVFGRGNLSHVKEYIEAFGDRLGFEILPKFDLPEYEEELKKALPLFEGRQISFHGPVYEVEHSAPRGSAAYEESMRHIRLTLPYARHLESKNLVMHLNNCAVLPGKKEEMLAHALENYRELEEMFGAFGCRIYVENTGTVFSNTMLLDQKEFTDLCRSEHFDVLIDIGHANANGWDLSKLVTDLKDRIRAFHLHNNDGRLDQHRRLHDGTIDFTALKTLIDREVPSADRIIEYVRPDMDGEGLFADIREILGISRDCPGIQSDPAQ